VAGGWDLTVAERVEEAGDLKGILELGSVELGELN
jgi:hypothetical protein